MSNRPVAEVFPLLWSDDPAGLARWAMETLGLEESWRAPPTGEVEHIELHWPGGGKVSINIRREIDRRVGPAGFALRIDDRAAVERLHARAVAAGAEIVQGPEDSFIAFSFTARDPEGNDWWVNAENGVLDGLRAAKDE